MSKRPYREGDEPVPGYQLDEFLGRGGFGEVWKARGPGGVNLAVKIIRGLDRKKGGKELEALKLLKDIRHPNIVPLTGFWLKTADGLLVNKESSANNSLADDGTASLSGDFASGVLTSEHPALAVAEPAIEDAEELIIAMGLAEQSLQDLLEQSHRQGEAGIDFAELLTYMEDASRAIDLLNTKHNIQHCDIKPQNILVQSGAVQVADFGLATSIGDAREQSMVSATIAYAAPEVLFGQGPGPATDQYSLAVTYYELRTGALPFDCGRISDVIDAKQHGKIDLARLAADERAVIAKATGPAVDRYPSAGEMVQALQQCSSDQTSALETTAYDVDDFSSTSPTDAPSTGLATGRRRLAIGLLVGAGAAVLFTAMAFLAQSIHTSAKQTAEAGRHTAEAAKHTAAAGQQTAEAADHTAEAAKQTATAGQQTASAAKHTAEAAKQTAAAGRLTAEAAKHSAEAGQQTAEAAKHTAVAGQRTAEAAKQTAAAGQHTAEAARQTAEAAKQSAAATGRIAIATDRTAENTKRIADEARQTTDNTRTIAETTERISVSLEAIRRDLAKATRHDGIIDTPSIPSDFYHNARQYELRGDYPNARRAYVRFFGFDLEVLDPHQRYQRMLMIQQGRAATHREYAGMEQTAESLVVPFMTVLSKPDEVRLKSLSSFVESHPTFAPAVWELSREYSKARLGVQSLADKGQEKQLLDSFMQLSDGGHLLRYFLDQTVPIGMISDAKTRLAALRQFDPEVLNNPIRLNGLMSNSGWTINLALAEASQEIEFRRQGETDYESTGHMNYVDSRTGNNMPKPFFQLPLREPAGAFEVKYKDIRGNWQGPFKVPFDPQSERVRWGKSILEQLTNNWITFREFRGESLAYFSHLLSYRYAIQEVRYSIGSENLDQVFPLPPIDPSNPSSTPSDAQLYLTLPESTTFITVQITYEDGTKSKVVRFDRPTASR